MSKREKKIYAALNALTKACGFKRKHAGLYLRVALAGALQRSDEERHSLAEANRHDANAVFAAFLAEWKQDEMNQRAAEYARSMRK